MSFWQRVKIFFGNFFFNRVPNTRNALGALKSIDDYRSHIIAGEMAKSASQKQQVPNALLTDFQKIGIAIMNQLLQLACVSHSIVYLIKLYFFLKTGKVIDFSPRFLDIISGLKKYNGYYDFKLTDGRDPLTVLKMAMKYGCATTATIPNDTSLSIAEYRNPAVLTQEVFDEADQYKIPGYTPIALNQESIRNAVRTYGASSLLFQIGKELWTDIWGNPTYQQIYIDPLRPPKTIIGGHQMTDSGYNVSLEHLINSWGQEWAENGEADYLWNEWSSYILEGWAITEIPTDILKTVQSLPSPRDFMHNFSTQLKYGMSSEEVKMLQIALSILGFFTYPEITGNYLDVTANAVLAFQLAENVDSQSELISLHGKIVGPKTLQALNGIFNKKVV